MEMELRIYNILEERDLKKLLSLRPTTLDPKEQGRKSRLPTLNLPT
jgi:hypothetical protein